MSDLAGATLGRYQVIARLGRGGMADVYKGFQPSLDRYVAIKVLHPSMVEETEFVQRFQREAKNVARLRHPNIIQVFDYDHEGDIYYMVMEFLDGPTLKAGSGRSPPPPGGDASSGLPAHHRRCRRRAVLCPRDGRRPSRRQAGQHHARPVGPGHPDRFRRGQDV